MKKMIAMTLALLMMMATLVACSNDTHSTTPSTDDPSDTTVADAPQPSTDDPSETTYPSDDVSFIQEAPSADEALDAYRAEVAKRLAAMANEDDSAESFDQRLENAIQVAISYPDRFLDDEEKEYLESIEYDFDCSMYFPILYRMGKNVAILHTNQFGDFDIEVLGGSKYAWDEYPMYSEVHSAESEDRIVENGAERAISYDSMTGEVTVWFLGEQQEQLLVPENSVYTGFSYWEGFIFRSGSDVYAVKLSQWNQDTNGVHAIAHGVKEVVVADYYLNSDAWSNPLFLMEDGSLKAYSSWNGEGELDDESRLVDPVEGGYGVNITFHD